MNKRNKCYKILGILLMMTLMLSSVLPVNQAIPVQAAEKIKLTQKSLTLKPGDTKSLQVKGTKKKVTWKSSNTKVVTVSSKGVLKTKKAGKAVITAKVDSKKLTCNVVVKSPVNKYVTSAPFDAKEIDFGSVKSVMPKDWTYTANASGTYYINPSSMDISQEDYTGITLQIVQAGVNVPTYDVVKDLMSQYYTVEKLEDAFKSENSKVTVTDLETSDVSTTWGTSYTVKCNVNYSDDTKTVTQKMVFYNLYFDQYFISLAVVNAGNTVTPDVNQVGEYLLNSLQIEKQ